MSRDAVYDLNDYLLNATPVGGLLGWTNAPGEYRPIIPVQQQPEMNEENPTNPYMVYVTRTSPGIEQWWISMDEVTYTVWGKTLGELTNVTNELMDILKRLDDSAQELDAYLRSVGRRDFDFYYVRVVSVFSPEATAQEAGRYGKPITIRYEYANLRGRGVA